MKKIILFSALAILSFACSNETQKMDYTETEHQSTQQESEFDQKMAAIDADDLKNGVSNSLSYSNEKGKSESATIYLKNNKDLVKMIYFYNDPTSGNYGRNIFYFEKGKKIASKEIYYDNTLSSPAFVERHTYYDKKGKAIFTKEKSAEYEVDLDYTTMTPAKIKAIDEKRTYQILNQEGDFETTFQGTVENESAIFLIVGPNRPNAYTSALSIQNFNGDINLLMKNPKKYVGVPLNVQHQQMEDEKGFQFQVLLNLEIKK